MTDPTTVIFAKSTFAAGGRIFWIGDRIPDLRSAGTVWLPGSDQSRRPGERNLGSLDAWLHAVPGWRVPVCRPFVVGIVQHAAAVHYRTGVYRGPRPLVGAWLEPSLWRGS